MEITTNKELESTGYRCLFEGVKKEGVEPFLNLAKDIKKISQRETLICQTIFSGSNDLMELVKKHHAILKYFQEHKVEFTYLKLTNEKVAEILEQLAKDNSLLDGYLENANKLESLNIFGVRLVNFKDYYAKDCNIFRNKEGKIISINKYYTDGQIETNGEEILVDELFNNSKIFFSINYRKKISFILAEQNNENLYQYREIYIENFGFDSIKLPSEEELQSYEIPEEFRRKRTK